MKDINNNDSTSLKDYEIEIKEKSNFISKILNKIKFINNKKMLTSGNLTIKRTHLSISFMWNMSTFKTTIFKNFDKICKLISKKSYSSKNNYKVHIIGKNTSIQEDELILNKDSSLSDVVPIIPKAISKAIQYNKSENTENNKINE